MQSPDFLVDMSATWKCEETSNGKDEKTKKKSRVIPSPYMREFWGEHIFAE